VWLAAIRFYLVGMGASLIVAFVIVGGWTVREMMHEITARSQPGAEGRAAQRLFEGGATPGEAAAQAQQRERCLAENLVAGLGAAASQVITRACDEVSRGEEGAAAWACVISMRSTLLNAPNPSAVLRACGVR
jgi:hypothetical protein